MQKAREYETPGQSTTVLPTCCFKIQLKLLVSHVKSYFYLLTPILFLGYIIKIFFKSSNWSLKLLLKDR